MDGRAFICTSRASVKARNILANPRVAFALAEGNDPVVIERSARILEIAPENIADRFRTKYEWDIYGDNTYNAVIEITPLRIVL